MAATSWSNSTVNNETSTNATVSSSSSLQLQQQQQPPTSLLEESTDNIIVAAAVAVAAVSAAATAVLMLDNVKESDNPTTTEIQLLSPPSPNDTSTTTASPETQLFAEKLQMKLKSHLLESEVVSATDQDDYYNLTHEDDESNNTNTINPGGSATEVFYDFDDIVLYTNGSDELTSDYGTGCSNSTVVPDSCGSSVVGVVDVKLEDLSLRDGDDDTGGIGETRSLPKYQRSSSLKTGKTPPGTPMKKIVRFADAMGLDLIDIKVFMDEVPRVPKEAYRDLHIPDFNSTNTSLSSSSPFDFYKPFSYSKTSSGGNPTSTTPNNLSNFVPLFHQPITLPDFFDKIRDQKVLLENAYLTQETVTKELIATSRQVIKGTVRVINLDFHKSVYVRYTYNDWKEFYDFQATYITDSCDGYTDRFEFKIEIDESKLPAPYLPDHDDAKITFACRFHCQGTQFWDNNQERNYVFQNVPVVKSSSGGKGGSSSVFVASNSRYSSFDDDYEWYNNRSGSSKAVDKSKLDELLGSSSSGKGNPVAAAAIITPTTPKNPAIQRKPKETTPPLVLPSLNYSIPPPQPTYPDTTTNKMLDLNDCGFESKILSSNLITGANNNNNSCNHGGGSHLSSSLYTPSSFYESAYACPYSNNFGSACFY